MTRSRSARVSAGAAALAGALGMGAFGAWAAPQDRPFDLLVLHARVVDGAGGPWFRADVGIRDDRIARIGALEGMNAARTIDAEDRVLAPGFIDPHVHVEKNLLASPDAENLVADGVTTIVTGNCGASEPRLSEWFERLEREGIAVNVASLVGHNTVRAEVLGYENRAPSERELRQMEALVERGMRDGAVGISSGLIYSPGTFAGSSELAALAATARRFGGIYATHMRSENDRVFEAIAEALAVARRARVPLEISHYKVTSRALWGSSARMLGIVEAARREGVDVTVDQYPYTASSSGLEVLLPDWVIESSGSPRHAMLRRLREPRSRRRIAKEMRARIHGALGRNHLDYAVVARAPWDTSLEGRDVRSINAERGRADDLSAEIETVLDLCEQGAESGAGGVCGTQMVYRVMDEADVERIFEFPLTMVGRDGGVETAGSGHPHPRSYGTSARVLARFVRERALVPLEDAVRKMTSLPAQRFGFSGRGLVKEGFWADLVLFDPDEVEDLASFQEPHRLSRGFDLVLVNGRIARENGTARCERAGKVLRNRVIDSSVHRIIEGPSSTIQ